MLLIYSIYYVPKPALKMCEMKYDDDWWHIQFIL